MQTIDAKTLKQRLDADEQLLLVDVRGDLGFADKHLPGALHISVHEDDFLEKMSEVAGGDKDADIVVYCSSTQCQASPTAAKKLVAAGYTNVVDFEEGVAGWGEAEYDFA